MISLYIQYCNDSTGSFWYLGIEVESDDGPEVYATFHTIVECDIDCDKL